MGVFGKMEVKDDVLYHLRKEIFKMNKPMFLMLKNI